MTTACPGGRPFATRDQAAAARWQKGDGEDWRHHVDVWPHEGHYHARRKLQRSRPAADAGKSPYRQPSVASRATLIAAFSPAVCLAVRTRAGSGDPAQALCECHGLWLGLHGGQLQHRRARGRGGSRDPLTGSACNAFLMCDAGHAEAETRSRETGPEGAGWWIRSTDSPLLVPVLLASPDGGIQVRLGRDGGYLDLAGNVLELARCA